MLHSHRSRHGSVGTHPDTDPARRDVHKFRHIVLLYPRTGETPSYNYIDTHVARRYIHELLHDSRIQPLRCPHFYHHTHCAWTDHCPHSPRRSDYTTRIPDRHASWIDSHRAWWQVDTDRVRHSNIARLNHHQHHQPPRREQHSHKHGDNNLLRDRIEL